MKGVANTRRAGTHGDVRKLKALRSRAWYRKQRNSGGCVRCAGKADRGKRCCQRCRAANATAQRARRARDNETGTCTRCHCDPARAGLATCRGCAEEAKGNERE